MLDSGRVAPDRKGEMAASMRQSSSGGSGTNIARPVALIVGIAYLAIGVIGFAATGFTGFVSDGDDKLIGFDLNIFHNIVHLAVGAGLLIGSRLRDVTIVQGMLIGGGLVYLLAALLGFMNHLQIISIDDHLAIDNFLHLISGAAAFAVGVLGALQQDDEAPLEGGARFQTAAASSEGPLPIEERRALWDR